MDPYFLSTGQEFPRAGWNSPLLGHNPKIPGYSWIETDEEIQLVNKLDPWTTTCCRIFETKNGGILIYAWPVASSKIHGLLGGWIQPVLSKIRQLVSHDMTWEVKHMTHQPVWHIYIYIIYYIYKYYPKWAGQVFQHVNLHPSLTYESIGMAAPSVHVQGTHTPDLLAHVVHKKDGTAIRIQGALGALQNGQHGEKTWGFIACSWEYHRINIIRPYTTNIPNIVYMGDFHRFSRKPHLIDDTVGG